MAKIKILPPWISTDDHPPEEGMEAIWMDVDGGYHLAKRKGQKVLPAVYGNADNVERNYRDHVCWKYVVAPKTA